MAGQVIYFRCAGGVTKFKIHSAASSAYPKDCSSRASGGQTGFSYYDGFASGYYDCYLDTVTTEEGSGTVYVRSYSSSTAANPSSSWTLASDKYVSTKTSPRYIEVYADPPVKYTITTYAYGGGTVSGGGEYLKGKTCTLSATPQKGSTATNYKWQKYNSYIGEYEDLGVENQDYSFEVSESAAYRAYFYTPVVTLHNAYFKTTTGVSSFKVSSGGAEYTIGSTSTKIGPIDNSTLKIESYTLANGYEKPKLYYNLTADEGYTTSHSVDLGNVPLEITSKDFNRYIMLGASKIPTYSATASVHSSSSGMGSVSGSKTAVYAGVNVTFSATAKDGYSFVKWVNSAGTQMSTSSSYTFKMPESDVTYYAVFIKNKPDKFSWSKTIAKGQPLSNLIASDWRRLQDTIDAVGGTAYQWTRVESGKTGITAAIFNQARDIIASFSRTGGIVSKVTQGQVITASLFEGTNSIKEALNDAIDNL